MGPVLAAAFLEWFLFLAAFDYCLVKVFQKAENWTVRLMAVIMMICFSTMRYDILFIYSALLIDLGQYICL